MLAHRNIVKDLGRLAFWYPLRWLVQLLPFPAASGIGRMLGDIDYVLSGRKRVHNLKASLARALNTDGREVPALVRANLRNHCRDTLEFIRYPALNSGNIDRVVSCDRIDLLDEALNKGKGVLLMTAHFGAKQMLQVGLGHRGYTVNQIHYHMESEKLSFVQEHVSQRLRIAIEKEIPTVFISADGFMRGAFRSLGRNEILIVTGDGSGVREHIDDSYQPIPFLGKNILFPGNTISLAERTGAVILPAFVVREGARHRIIFETPIDPSISPSADIAAGFVQLLERYVRSYPDHWEFWEEFGDPALFPDREG